MNLPLDDLPLRFAANAAGQARRVAVELEFSYLEPALVAALLIAEFGGSARQTGDYQTRVRVPGLGDFTVEVELSILRRITREPLMEEAGLLDPLAGDLAEIFSLDVVPCRIITPPLLADKLPRLDRLVSRLREVGTEGSEDLPIQAFGVRFSPEAPALDAGSILCYLRAFVLLHDWLRSELGVDASNQFSAFIPPYPDSYVHKILARNYRPTLAGLMDDYLADNPSPHRPLDLLPLFAHLDEARVRAALGPNHPIAPSPSYHYCLPNGHVAHPDWRITDEWYYWLVLEWLAADSGRLDRVTRAHRRWMAGYLPRCRGDWVRKVPAYLPEGPWSEY